jgi:hypothetical protein
MSQVADANMLRSNRNEPSTAEPSEEIAMPARRASRFRFLGIGAAALLASAVTAVPADATTTGAITATCGTVSIATMNAALAIDAAHVTSVRPPKNPKALICSYYGNSGRAANEATINYLPATARSFAALKASNASSHHVRTITGIKTSAYSYEIGTENYLYVLNGTDQVQIFATVPLSKLEILARKMPSLS